MACCSTWANFGRRGHWGATVLQSDQLRICHSDVGHLTAVRLGAHSFCRRTLQPARSIVTCFTCPQEGVRSSTENFTEEVGSQICYRSSSPMLQLRTSSWLGAGLGGLAQQHSSARSTLPSRAQPGPSCSYDQDVLERQRRPPNSAPPIRFTPPPPPPPPPPPSKVLKQVTRLKHSEFCHPNSAHTP